MSKYRSKYAQDKIREFHLGRISIFQFDEEIDQGLYDMEKELSKEQALRERYAKALKRIQILGLDVSLGQIVGSEHYEKAWLDCVEIATEALEPSRPPNEGKEGKV